ncbi:hypothetical protein [Bradyrhizobium japonicum]|nr:hypothetical protein [Bradyrhizobium japonicum]
MIMLAIFWVALIEASIDLMLEPIFDVIAEREYELAIARLS